MSLATNNARTAIIELLDGTLPSDFVDAGLFAHGVFDGQPAQAQKAMAVQTALATHRFDVQFTANSDHRSAVSRIGDKRLVTLGVTIPVWTHVATPAQETDRNAVMADIGADMAAAMRGLGYPQALAETDAGGATNIVGGLLHGPSGDGFPRWSVVRADWNTQLIQSQITGSLILNATVTNLPTIADVVTSVELIADLDPANIVSDTHFSWTDSGPYGNHFTMSGDARPTLVPNWLDNNNGVSFDGIQQYLWRSVMRGLAAGDKPCVLVVCQAHATQLELAPTIFQMDGEHGSYSSGNANRLFNLEHTATAVRAQTHLGASGDDLRANGSITLGSSAHWILAVSSASTNKPQAWFDGVLKGTSGGSAAGGVTDTPLEMAIGGGTAGSDPSARWFRGTIGRLIVFSGEPTSGEWAEVFSQVLAPQWPSLSWGFA